MYIPCINRGIRIGVGRRCGILPHCKAAGSLFYVVALGEGVDMEM